MNIPHTHQQAFDLGSFSLKAICNEAYLNNTSQELIVCIHGWQDNAASFIPIFPYLTDKRLIAIDLPGHGLSDHKNLDAHYHFFDWVHDIYRLFELNNWSNVHLVGHSMGGMISSAFAAAFPEKIASLTLIDTLGFITTPAQETSQQLRKGVLSRIKVAPSRSFETREYAIKVRKYNSGLSEEHARILTERAIRFTSEGGNWRTDVRLKNISLLRLTLEQASQLIQDIQCPVQLVYGDKGYLKNKGYLQHYTPLFTRFQQHELAGHHHIHMEEGEKTAKFIEDLISDLISN